MVRYQGGNNAGHTVIAEGRLLKLQLMPSGVLYPRITSVIADGVVVDPRRLLEEIDEVARSRGGCLPAGRERQRAPDHAVPPGARQGHRAVPGQRDRHHGRGIGPDYGDKINRIGIRVQDLFDERSCAQKVEVGLEREEPVLVKIYNRRALDVERDRGRVSRYADRLKPMVADTRSC